MATTELVAFTNSVKRLQEQLGSRQRMKRLSESGRWGTTITDDLAQFLVTRRSIFFGTASRDGCPYIQHRGGPEGFLKITGPTTIVFDEQPGNQQYISFGNLAENDRAFIFALDYPTKTRVKLWGRAHVSGLDRWDKAHPPQMTFHLEAWDQNCKRNIPDLWPMEAVETATEKLRVAVENRDARIAELERLLQEKSGA